MGVERVIAFVPETPRAARDSTRLILSQIFRQMSLQVKQDVTQVSAVMEDRIGNIGDDPRFYYHGAHRHYLGWSSSSKGGARRIPASPKD